MNAEFFEAIEAIEKEKGIPQDYMLEKIRAALLTAFKRDNPDGELGGKLPDGEDAVVVDIDREKKTMSMYVRKAVTQPEEIVDPSVQITPDEAKHHSKKAQLGDVINIPVETKKFGRIAAQAAKQVIIQGIREAERGIIFDEFTSKEHEILTGVVSRIDNRTGAVSIKISSNSEYTEAMLPATESIKGEVLREGDRIKVYVVEVRKLTRGPQVLISRTHPGLVKRLFELEVPEIFDGTVEIRSIAREAGSRTKMAVTSMDAMIDPVGACVGPRGSRVDKVVTELKNEKIDIIKWSADPAEFVANALNPAYVVQVLQSNEEKICRVVVPDNQLSLAIGKEGQNARLAAKLTGWKIDIKSVTQYHELRGDDAPVLTEGAGSVIADDYDDSYDKLPTDDDIV